MMKLNPAGMEFARLMSLGRWAVPRPFRKRADRCLAIVMYATVLGVSPYSLAGMAYFVRNGRRRSKMVFDPRVKKLINERNIT
jgi:hypothetical protein